MAEWLERSPREREEVVRSPTVSYKDVINIVPYASLLIAQHIRIGLASLSSQTSYKNEMDFIQNERSTVINIS